MRPKSITIDQPSETEKLIALVNQVGLSEAAKQYDTNPSSLSRWIRSQGYELTRVYVLTEVAKAALENARQ